jgi:uncharacterized protein YndB with AHSA1/START domain
MIRAAMRPFEVSRVIDAPRERVFDYLSDIANHAEFTDHFVKDFRLERVESRGVGAAARFRIVLGLGSIWCEQVLTKLERPYSIVAEGRGGRLARIEIRTEYRLTLHDQGMTRVQLTFSTLPATSIDRLREALGARMWLGHQQRRSLRRLQFILEQGEPSAHAARVAAGES